MRTREGKGVRDGRRIGLRLREGKGVCDRRRIGFRLRDGKGVCDRRRIGFRVLEGVRDGEGFGLQSFTLPKAKLVHVPVTGPDLVPGSHNWVVKHHPQRESATQVAQVVSEEHGELGHSRKNHSVQLLGLPPGPFTSPVKQSPVS
jgi:hypothetical protein